VRPLLLAALLALVGCSGSDAGSAATSSSTASAVPSGPPGFDQALHDELIAMLERDQGGRTGGSDAEGDAARTERMKEILDEHGWPTFDLVGVDGEDAAWAIVQHSDQDPAFQREALELLRGAVATGQGSPGNLAYLTDRIAAGAGEPQTYGTQVGCGPDGPVPAPLADEAAVDARRAEVGLEPMADYLAEMAAICAED